ncbi:MAG: hypothetical protein GTO22_01155, partial [Gemmatimonadales bacterium]|nr:hypothetical protein [Gemmatimonadales bacterium]
LDCNGNGVPDACDIADGTSDDADGDGVPDECDADTCPWDCAEPQDNMVDTLDFLQLLADWGP